MTALNVSMTVCAISFLLMFVSIGHLIWRTYRERGKGDSDAYITLTRSELEAIIEKTIEQTLEEVRKHEELRK